MELALPGSPWMWKRLISIVASPEFTDWPAVSSEGARQRRGLSSSRTEDVALVCFSCGRSWSQPLPSD